MGERAVLLEFASEISPETLKAVLGYKKYLQQNLIKSKLEVTNTFNSLLISYQSHIEDSYSDVFKLMEEIFSTNIHFKMGSILFHIPVCYDDVFALDLEEISRAKKLSKNDIIGLHSSEEYLVYFTGFLPGFLYLGGLPKALHFSRRKHPRPKVEKGAVGIGEKQTGIYPQESPGGWNIIGNSPVPLFDPSKKLPCKIRAGDRIKFYEISLEEHREIACEVEKGEFELKSEEVDGAD